MAYRPDWNAFFIGMECNKEALNKEFERNYIGARKGILKRRAHYLVHVALKSGALKQSPCEDCGDQNSHGHHADYFKPLDIAWLCRKHHRDRHPRSGYRRVSFDSAMESIVQ